MFGYNWIDSTRFGGKERKFFRLAILEDLPREEVCDIMCIGDSHYYNYRNKIMDRVEKDFRRYKILHRSVSVPYFIKKYGGEGKENGEPKPEDLEEKQTLQQVQDQYKEKIGKLPNRYKNDIERLQSKIAWYSSK